MIFSIRQRTNLEKIEHYKYLRNASTEVRAIITRPNYIGFTFLGNALNIEHFHSESVPLPQQTTVKSNQLHVGQIAQRPIERLLCANNYILVVWKLLCHCLKQHFITCLTTTSFGQFLYEDSHIYVLNVLTVFTMLNN